MDGTRARRTRDKARQAWYARHRQRRFARFLGFGETARDAASTPKAGAGRSSRMSTVAKITARPAPCRRGPPTTSSPSRTHCSSDLGCSVDGVNRPGRWRFPRQPIARMKPAMIPAHAIQRPRFVIQRSDSATRRVLSNRGGPRAHFVGFPAFRPGRGASAALSRSVGTTSWGRRRSLPGTAFPVIGEGPCRGRWERASRFLRGPGPTDPTRRSAADQAPIQCPGQRDQRRPARAAGLRFLTRSFAPGHTPRTTSAGN